MLRTAGLTCLQRYLTLKAMSPEERKKVNKKVVFFAGKAAPGYYVAKLVRAYLPIHEFTSLTPYSDDPPHRERG